MSVTERSESSASRLIRAVRVGVFFAISPLYILSVIAIVLVSKDVRHWYPLARMWADHSLRWFRVHVEAVGASRIEPGRDYVLLCNHRSHFDIFALFVSLPHTYTRWVAKRELTKVPLFGYGLKVSGQILVDRKDHGQAISELRRHLGESGVSVVFFAEGQRSDDSRLMPFKKGGAAFAIDAGLPVVPVAISGSERVLEKHSLMVRPGTIRLQIGEAIETTGLAPEDRDSVTERAHAQVAAMLATLEPHQPAVPTDKQSEYPRGAKAHV